MDWKDIAGMVGKAAPMLGTVLTGPLGTAVAVGGMIASAIGTDPTPDAVAAAIAADPAALARIRELELQHDVTKPYCTSSVAPTASRIRNEAAPNAVLATRHSDHFRKRCGV